MLLIAFYDSFVWCRTRSVLAGTGVVLAACGSGLNETASSVAASPGDPSAVTPSTDSLTPESTEPGTSDSIIAELQPDGGWVEVVVIGAVGRNPDGAAELCPFPGPCFGIPIAGDFDEALDGRYVSVSGTFDGVELMPEAPPREVPSPYQARTLEPLCDEVPTGGRVDPVAGEAIARYLETVPEVHAGTWIDTSQRVMTYWFVGDDVSEQRDAINELAGGAAVCVSGGARWSRAELEALADQVSEILRPDAAAGSSWGANEVENVVTVNVGVLDPALRAELDALGDRVRLVTAFIELPDDPREHLPPLRPVVAGDLAILIQRDGGRNGEDSGGRFAVRFDPARNCVWFEPSADHAEGTRRFVPVWPDGYTATSDPLVIRDFDGRVVANEGDIIELGGGYHDPTTLDRWSNGTGDCGADGTDAMFVVTR